MGCWEPACGPGEQWRPELINTPRLEWAGGQMFHSVASRSPGPKPESQWPLTSR